MRAGQGLRAILAELKASPAAYLSAARAVEALEDPALRPLRVAFLSTATLDLLRPYLVVEGARRGYMVRPHFGAFNQLEQQALDPASDLYRAEPSVVVVFTLLDDLVPALADRFLAMSKGAIDEAVATTHLRLDSLVEALRRHTEAPIALCTFAPPEELAAGPADAMLESSQSGVVQRMNDAVRTVSRRHAGTFVFDYARTVIDAGLASWRDPRLWFMGRVPFGSRGQMVVGAELMRWMSALLRPPSKCLVVDLDNTIWGGVVGEDGPDGIALGAQYPGNVFRDFQQFLLRLRDRGILLAVASKNNEPDALAVLERHPDCLLRPSMLAACEIGWQDKATSLRAIARTLNIGTDALAFFDDNPVEREWIRTQMPEVAVIDPPRSPTEYVRAVRDSGCFDQVVLSSEDRFRGSAYQQEHARDELRSTSISLDTFLRDLEMSATIGSVDAGTLARVSQLILKTNQFNLTIRRHSPAELQSLLGQGAVCQWMRASDRFGDHGLVGVAIAVPRDAGTWAIDTLLLSCRVLGRGLERALMSALIGAIRTRGGRVVTGEYVAGPKNTQVAELYPRLGFEPVEAGSAGWTLDVTRQNIESPDFIRVSVVV